MRRLRRVILATLLLTILGVVTLSAWLLWPRPLGYYRDTLDRSGFVPGNFLPEHPVVRWSFTPASTPHDPVVAWGTVYAGDDLGNIYALSADTGKMRWQHAHGHGQIFTAPAVVGSRVIFTCGEGVAAVSRRTGTLLWETSIPGGANESSPLPIRRLVYVGGKDGKIYALAIATGKVIWTQDILSDRPPAPSPRFNSSRANVSPGERARPRIASSDGVTLYQPIFDQSRLVALDCKTGMQVWSFQAGGWIFGEPTITEKCVFIGAQDRNLYCLDKATGQVIWSCATSSRVEAGAAMHNGSVFFGSCDKSFYCVDAESGRVKWSYQTGGAIYSSPFIARDIVYFGSFDGYLYALNTADGTVKWKIQPFPGAEVASTPSTNGQLIFFSTRGTDAIVAVAEGPQATTGLPP